MVLVFLDAENFRQKLEQKNPPEEVKQKPSKKEIERMTKFQFLLQGIQCFQNFTLKQLLSLPWKEKNQIKI